MAMTQQQFDELVSRLEQEASSNPAGYKLKLGAFASLGYLYVLAVLVGLVGVIALLIYGATASTGLLLIAKKLIIPIVVLIGLVLKAMWVKLEPPTGLKLKRKQFPELFRVIDEVRKVTKAPKAHEVLLTSELNAAIVQIPRLGLFGWQKNYLILGLQLLEVMTLDEFKAVLAHEFGHLSGAHGRFGAWIYRVRAAWARLNESLRQEEHIASFLFVPFFGWFAPTFAAYSFVQARQQEYEADALAAETVGADVIGNALVRLDVKAQDLEQNYWPKLYARAEAQPEPDAAPYSTLLQSNRRGFLPQAKEQLQVALQRETNTADTHPSLSDRIAALNASASLPPPLDTSAAEAVFGNSLDDLLKHFDSEWRAEVADWWQQRFEYAKNGKDRLLAFSQRGIDALSTDELFDYAQVTEEFGEEAQALCLYRAVVDRDSTHLGGRYAVGRMLLQADDEQGLGILEKLMDETPHAIQPACNVIVGYLERNGREGETQPYVDRYWAQQEHQDTVDRERGEVRPDDDFVPHRMKAESLAELTAILSASGKVKTAYLVEKRLQHSDAPLFILGIQASGWSFGRGSAKSGAELVQELAQQVTLEEEIILFPLHSENSGFKKLIRKVEGAKIFPRE